MSQPVAPIVTICGSMRFFELMLTVAAEETAQGRIVLAPFSVVAPEDQSGELKTMLDELHLRKIDMAERVIVVTNQDGYIGESTRREMTYALQAGKALDVREFRTDPAVIDGRRMVGAGHAIRYPGYASTQFDERTGLYQSVMMETPTPPKDPTGPSSGDWMLPGADDQVDPEGRHHRASWQRVDFFLRRDPVQRPVGNTSHVRALTGNVDDTSGSIQHGCDL